MGQKCCSLVSTICTCLSCGKGRYTVRAIHTALCIGIPANLIYNKHSDLNAWLVGHRGSFLYGFLYLALVLTSLIFYYAACLTDPGYVDQNTLMRLINDEDNEEDLYISGESGSSSRTTHNGYSPIHTSEPRRSSQQSGDVTSVPPIHTTALSDGSEVEIEIDDLTESSTRMLPDNRTSANQSAANYTQLQCNDDPVRMCKVCNIPQPLRSRHCEDCRRCVLKYDHHCPWLSTCVGEKNHRFFWLFLLFINLVVLSSFVLAVRAFPSHKSKDEDIPMSDVANMLFIIFDGIVLFVAVLSAIPLFGFHSYLMITNQTTWESVSRNKITYLKKVGEDINPFHMGYCRNVYSFFCRCAPYKWNVVYKRSSSTVALTADS